MSTRELIGKVIGNIHVFLKVDVGGLDEGFVFIELTDGKVVEIPWDFESENVMAELHTEAEIVWNTKFQNQRITNFIQINNSLDRGFLELENGMMITEVAVAPHGTGLAGLRFFETRSDFELVVGVDYNCLVN